MESKLLIIRHGITEGNKNKWFYGSTDLPLLEEGKAALRKMKEEGLYPEVPEEAQFFTTGLVRTEETLEILFGEREHGAIPDLQEMKFGEYECRAFDDLEEDEVFLDWGYDETGDVALPGGESRNEFNARVERGIEKLLESHRLLELKMRHGEHPATTVLICHGGVVSSIMNYLYPAVKGTLWDWMTEPGSGYEIIMKDGVPAGHRMIGEADAYFGKG